MHASWIPEKKSSRSETSMDEGASIDVVKATGSAPVEAKSLVIAITEYHPQV
jgi:hypothetical protein